MIVVKASQLNKVCPNISPTRCNEIAAVMNQKIAEYGINSWDEFHEFVGQVAQESGEFSHKTEDMYYQAQTLANTWPNTFSSTKKKPYSPNGLASKYAKNPKALANFKYGGKYGNRPGTDDGWNLRGGGFIGLTFRELWTKYAKYKGMTVEAASEWVRSTDEGAMDSAFWFFYVYRDLEQLAIADDDLNITKKINGGTIGLQKRKEYSDRARQFLN